MMRPALIWLDCGLLFGVDRAEIVAIDRSPALSPIPLAPGWMVGVLNRFGRAVAVVDVALMAGLKAGPSPVRQVLIVAAESGELGIALAEAPRDERVGGGRLPEGAFSLVDAPAGLRLVSPEGLARGVAAKLGGGRA